RATFKEIAQAAGVSKATLNRFCGTRDNLIEMLLDHGSVVIYRVIADADLESAPLDALHRLIEGHLTHRELLVFLSFQWRPDTFDLDAGGCRWLPYSETLDEFFLRGQKLGVFRIDIGAPALTEIFSSLIFGLVDAERRGRIARAGMAALIEQFFLNGACNYQT
ncbi:TetR/AcrR family transcriptional regulator, partial [Pseudomonas aeruginosa]